MDGKPIQVLSDDSGLLPWPETDWTYDGGMQDFDLRSPCSYFGEWEEGRRAGAGGAILLWSGNVIVTSGAAGQATPAHGGATPAGGVTPAQSTPGGAGRTPGGTVQGQTMIVSAHHYNQQQQLLY